MVEAEEDQKTLPSLFCFFSIFCIYRLYYKIWWIKHQAC